MSEFLFRYIKFYNIILHDFFRKGAHFFYNKEIHSICDSLYSLDSIKNLDEYYDEMKKVYTLSTKKGNYISETSYSFDSKFYGLWKSLCDYSNIKINDLFYTVPMLIEHGVNFSKYFNENIDKLYFSLFFQSEYKKAMYFNIPCFAIGPYIHYAKDYYNDDEFLKIKRKLGKVLLVFPTHRTEGDLTSFDIMDFIDKCLKIANKEYDSVVVCLYWADINNELINLYKSYGFYVCSAGFRSDNNFLNRLKSLIKLSDCTVTNDLGTNIGYSMYLNKKTLLIKTKNLYGFMNNVSFNKDIYFNLYEKFLTYFNYSMYDLYLVERKKIYDMFWGGENYIRSESELKNIIEICYDIMLRSYGFVNYRKHAIKSLLNYYMANNKHKYDLLYNSIYSNI